MNLFTKILGSMLCFFLITGQSVSCLAKSEKSLGWAEAVAAAKRSAQKMNRQGGVAFRSQVLKPDMPVVKISIDVTGWDDLILYTLDAGDGNSYDQSEWADARLTDIQGKTVWLDELKTEYEKAGYGRVSRNRSVVGGKIKLRGKVYDRGIAVHAPGELHFALDKQFKKLEVVIGIDDVATARECGFPGQPFFQPYFARWPETRISCGDPCCFGAGRRCCR